MSTDRPFKTTAYKLYAQVQPFQPAPQPEHRGTWPLLLAVLLAAAGIAAYYVPGLF